MFHTYSVDTGRPYGVVPHCLGAGMRAVIIMRYYAYYLCVISLCVRPTATLANIPYHMNKSVIIHSPHAFLWVVGYEVS